MDNILNKNLYLKDKYLNKRCFIVGTGPSLLTQDIKLLKDEVTIVVSNFFKHDDSKLVNPEYWIMADPLVWDKPHTYFYPKLNTFLEKEINIKLFVPYAGYNFFSNLNISQLYLHYYYQNSLVDINSKIDFSKGIPPFGQNVIIVGLMLAFYLGCNPIYFIGCDQDMYVYTKEEFKTKTFKHFYYESIGYKGEDFMTWDYWKFCVDVIDFQFKQLKLYADLWGVDVYNATNGGYLKYYPRIDYNSLF
jgi:hypothetical protein